MTVLAHASRCTYLVLAAIVALLLASALMVFAAGPYPALDTQATARIATANATSTLAYRAADTQTAAAQPTSTPVPPTPTNTPTALPTSYSASVTTAAITAPFTTASDVNGTYAWQTVDTFPIPANGGEATFTFSIAAGSYTTSGVVNDPTTGNNSFYVNMDSEPTDPTMVWDMQTLSTSTGTATIPVSWRGTGTVNAPQFNPKVFVLTAGTHTLRIRGRELNTKLYSVTVTPQVAPTPTPIPATPTPVPPTPTPTGGLGTIYWAANADDGTLNAWTFVLVGCDPNGNQAGNSTATISTSIAQAGGHSYRMELDNDGTVCPQITNPRAELYADKPLINGNSGGTSYLNWYWYLPSSDHGQWPIPDAPPGGFNSLTQFSPPLLQNYPNCGPAFSLAVYPMSGVDHLVLSIDNFTWDGVQCSNFSPNTIYDLGVLPYDTWFQTTLVATWKVTGGSIAVYVNNVQKANVTNVRTELDTNGSIMAQNIYMGDSTTTNWPPTAVLVYIDSVTSSSTYVP